MSHRSLRTPLTSPAHAAAASALAGSLVRDVVAALGALIVLVIVLLLIMSSRRRRALAGSGRPPPSHRGQHGHHRTGQETSRPTRPQLPTPVPPVSWPAPGGWQGGSVGEIAQPAPAAPPRPAVTPVARPAAANRSGAGMPSGPPWAPAAEPENTFGPLPKAPANLFTPRPGGTIRVPPDVTGPTATMTGPAAPRPAAFDPHVLPGTADSSAWPPLYDYTAPSPPVSPAPDLGAATIPGFPRLETGRGAEDSAFTRPIPAAGLSRRGLGFAAAPVATGYPTTDTPGYDRPEGTADAADARSWDLAATDVFPVASSEPSAGTGPDDDAPGASES